MSISCDESICARKHSATFIDKRGRQQLQGWRSWVFDHRLLQERDTGFINE